MSGIPCFKNHWKLGRGGSNPWRKKGAWFKVRFWSLDLDRRKLCVAPYWSLNSCEFNEPIGSNSQRSHRKIWLKTCSRALFSKRVGKNDWLLAQSPFRHWTFELFDVFTSTSLIQPASTVTTFHIYSTAVSSGLNSVSIWWISWARRGGSPNHEEQIATFIASSNMSKFRVYSTADPLSLNPVLLWWTSWTQSCLDSVM